VLVTAGMSSIEGCLVVGDVVKLHITPSDITQAMMQGQIQDLGWRVCKGV